MGEVDEAASLVHMFGALRSIGFMHLGRRAKVRYLQSRGGEIVPRAWEASAAQLDAFWQVHLILDTAQFERGETPLRGVLDDGVPIPFGAAESGNGNGQFVIGLG